ncbi:hypothetical protein [Dokdonella fugitiva]|jgi:hypothetical protein|uniref:Thioredoxin domain-containing protein n=1 Tax=Dokdonella fugitiva TaxID=328517 RepID=A0A4R2HXC6_9GAMM|nr:hypothetical protein [Dokdonella fugitiva]MBA8885758.1 hypothetical protein [Dokdonella fugitiva]TCO34715.1 hypothetical protein EV148_1174 [Dokdonella fugitiva]
MMRIAMAAALLLSAATVDAKGRPDLAKARAELMKISVEDIAPADRDRQLVATLERVQHEVERIGLARLRDADVPRWFDVAVVVAFYTLEPRHVRLVRGAVDEMVRRRMDVASQQAELMKLYVAARMLDDAQAYANVAHDGVMKLPRFDDESIADDAHPTLWYVSADASSVMRYSFPLDQGVRVVVNGHPWCPFSVKAGKGIERNARLAELMARYAVWIVPQHPMPNFGDIAQWNVQHPHLPMRVAYRAGEWRDITNWATPVFHFFVDGRLVDTVAGWPSDAQAERLVQAFRAVGVEGAE